MRPFRPPQFLFGPLLAIPFLAALLALPHAPGPSAAEPAGRPIVVELFTSQGCSSCPPADALLRELSRARPDVLALAFHITYWDNLGWPDPFALPASTERQRAYSRISHAGSVYTPQMIIEGTRDVVGSDRPAVLAALRAAEAAARLQPTLALHLTDDAQTVRITIGPNPNPSPSANPGTGAGRVLLVGYDPERRTAVARGENAGRALVEANIVRGLDIAGDWTGAALTLTRPRPAGQRLAVIVQAPDGSILAAQVGPS